MQLTVYYETNGRASGQVNVRLIDRVGIQPHTIGGAIRQAVVCPYIEEGGGVAVGVQ